MKISRGALHLADAAECGWSLVSSSMCLAASFLSSVEVAGHLAGPELIHQPERFLMVTKW